MFHDGQDDNTCLCGLSVLAAELGSLRCDEGAILELDIRIVAIDLPAQH